MKRHHCFVIGIVFAFLGVVALAISPIASQAQASNAQPVNPAASRTLAADQITMVDSAEAALSEVVNNEMREAVRVGLEELSRMQQDDGTFGSYSGLQIAITSLCGLALAASGSTPSSGPYAKNIRAAAEYVLNSRDTNTGYIAGDGSRIHGHGYALLFLSQLLGENKDPELDQRITHALKTGCRLLAVAQTTEGGWGYVPDDTTWDEGSTTIVCLQALRAAQSVGINVNSSVIARAIGYLQKIAEKQDFRDVNGHVVRGYHFKYSLSRSISSQSWSQAASAVSCLNAVGVYSKEASWNATDIGDLLRGGMDWSMHRFRGYMDEWRRTGKFEVHWFLYGNFYMAQATWQYSDPAYFREYFPGIRDVLVGEWRASGRSVWRGRSYGEAYQTAFALLILQVPYQYLPLYQR